MLSSIRAITKICLMIIVAGGTIPEYYALADDNTPETAEAKFEFEHVSCRGGPFEIRIVIEGVKKERRSDDRRSLP